MDDTDQGIADNERAFRVLRLKATRDALRIERACDHPLIVYERGSGGEWFGPHPTICICHKCRMEYHARWHQDPDRDQTRERRFVSPRVVGVQRIFALRTNDARPIVHSDRYDAHPPVRTPRKKVTPTPLQPA